MTLGVGAGPGVADRRWTGLLRLRVAEAAALVGVLAVAIIGRFWSLPTRGTWDADQGHDMRVLADLVTHGVVPLLGPPTSIGTFHHGALYYYLLAPAAWLGGSNPVVVVAEIAALGVLAVVLTALAARAVGGPLAGVLAGLLLAASASAIDESTFIWNPNLVPATAALAVLGVVRGMETARMRWWAAAWLGVALTTQCHVLGALLVPPVAVAHVAELARRDRSAADRAVITRALGLGVAILVVSFVPLAIHEVTNGFAETRAIVAFASAGGGSASVGIVARGAIVAFRVLVWPLVGLITDAPLVAAGAALAVGVAAVLLFRRAGARPRETRWLVGTLIWGIAGLAVAAPSLTTVVPGLPVDHYHAFLDPVVVIVVALALARIAQPLGEPVLIGRAIAAATVVAIVGFNVARWPPAVAADGGWPAAEVTAARVAARTNPGAPLSIVSLPSFKPADAYVFPLERLEVDVHPWAPGSGQQVVVVCDQLFRAAIGADCGGPAEDGLVAANGMRAVDRIESAPGRWVSLYAVEP